MAKPDTFPRKWKLYRILNYVQLVYSLLLFAIIVGLYIKNNIVIDLPFLLIPGGFLVMAANNYFNLFTLSSYFPDKPVPRNLEKTKTALLITAIFFNILLVILIIMGSTDEFSRANIRSFSEGKLLLAALVIIFAHSVYIVCMQVTMSRAIKQGYQRSMTTIINSIGQE